MKQAIVMFALLHTLKVLKIRLSLLLLSLRLTKNWYAPLIGYLLRKPVHIRFRNGIQGCFDTGTIYRILYLMRHGVGVKQISNNILELSLGNSKIRAPVRNVTATLEYIFVDEQYDCGIDYQGRTILDIGAYIGDTATYFWSKGASKIICYEPIEEFFYWLRQNVTINSINAELYNFGISGNGGEIEVPYEELNALVGFRGHKTIRIKTLSLSEVLHKHDIDICKFGCPCEQAILSLPEADLLKVPTWIIGTPSKRLKEELIDRFSRAGFKSKAITYKDRSRFEWYFLDFSRKDCKVKQHPHPLSVPHDDGQR